MTVRSFVVSFAFRNITDMTKDIIEPETNRLAQRRTPDTR
jgi:hypothetical protein